MLEAGIALKGSEVKSLRDGKGSIADSYAVDNNGEIFLINSHIPLYRQSSYNNHNTNNMQYCISLRKMYDLFLLLIVGSLKKSRAHNYKSCYKFKF